MTALLDRLREIVGARHVLTDADARAAYERDWTGRYHGQAAAVVRPATTAEVAAVVALAADTGTPVVPMGGNTGLVGGAVPPEGGTALILALDRMTGIRRIDAAARVAHVDAGVVLDQLNAALEPTGLFFPVSFGARGSCTIGGMLATNAGGSNVLRYGNTRALCLGIEAVSGTGDVLDLMSELRKDNSGYDLRDLMIGSEGTLGVITGAVLRLEPRPRAHVTALLALPSAEAALDLLNRIQDRSGGAVDAFEYMPAEYFERMAAAFPDMTIPLAEPGPANILLEIGAVSEVLAAPDATGRPQARALVEAVIAEALEAGQVSDGVIAESEAQRQALWALRERALEVVLAGGPVLLLDVSVPLGAVARFLAEADARVRAQAPAARTLSVAHIGDGNVHFNIYPGDGSDGAALMAAAEDLAVSLGGSFSAEHGVGLSKRPAMARSKPAAALAAMRAVKQALDPAGILNPGKLLP